MVSELMIIRLIGRNVGQISVTWGNKINDALLSARSIDLKVQARLAELELRYEKGYVNFADQIRMNLDDF